MEKMPVSRKKLWLVFWITILIGYILFIIPDVFFGVTKINGGKIGVNLFYISIFQLISICTLLHFSLKSLHLSFHSIGLTVKGWKRDVLLGLGTGLVWTLLQFLWFIPTTGGADREDIQGMLSMYDGSTTGLLSFIALGVIGGGITEEIFNRGFFISVFKRGFQKPKLGLWIASVCSILIFSLGHMPVSALDWFDILVPTILYTFLFIYTGRLTASILAHGLYNCLAILMVYLLYYG